MQGKLKRILVVRNDRLGDLVLTTPVFEGLKKAMPKCHVDALIAPGNLDLIKNNPFVDGILLDEYDRSIGGFLQLVRDLRKRCFDAGLMVVPSFRITLAMWMARIPLRIGPATHLYCYALLNRRIVQHRSRVEKHEAEYNLDLLKGLDVSPAQDIRTFVRPAAEDLVWAKEKVRELMPEPKTKKLVLVHPCSRGSARNWRQTQWAGLLKLLQNDRRFTSVLTGSVADRAVIDQILLTHKIAAASLAGQTTLGRFIAVMTLADAFIAPSTGPLHLAAGAGCRVFGIYPPIRVQSPKRWGPWRANESHALTPDAPCPATYRCQEAKCPSFDCMDRLSPETLYKEICRSLFPAANK